MVKKLKTAKEKIEILLKSKQLSTSRIGAMIGIDYRYVLKLLNELEQENKIVKNKTPNSIYWTSKQSKEIRSITK